MWRSEEDTLVQLVFSVHLYLCEVWGLTWNFFSHMHAYRFWVLNKDLGTPHLVLVWLHVDSTKQVLDTLAFISTPPWPCLRGQNGIPGGGRHKGMGDLAQPVVGHSIGQAVKAGETGASPLQELGELSTVGKACPSNPDVLLQAQVFHLVLHPVGTRWPKF